MFWWHQGPVPYQTMQVTYGATNEMSYPKMTLSANNYSRFVVFPDSFES